MEEEVTGSGGGIARKMAAGEVELQEKAGTAWSHSYLNQKPWHPLSYPNQRRKWIAEKTHANRARRLEEVQREFAQEQEFFRQTAHFSKKDKEKRVQKLLKLKMRKGGQIQETWLKVLQRRVPLRCLKRDLKRPNQSQVRKIGRKMFLVGYCQQNKNSKF